MQVVEACGDPRAIGQRTGEALREEIQAHVELFPQGSDSASWERRLLTFLETLRQYLPDVLEEMEGTAEGANVPLDSIYRLNLPEYPDDLFPWQECTNVVFSSGPDGPVWGKNNDGLPDEKRRPHCARLVRPDEGIPVLIFTFCGMLATMDAMNAEGLAVGHASVGSVFQQSDDHVPIRLWAYEGLMHCRTTAEFVRHMALLPTRGKGYSIVCVDREGTCCSIEAPCPLMQVRLPASSSGHMHCVNCYQLPALADADRRDELAKQNAIARWKLLDHLLSVQEAFGLEHMKGLLRHHADPSICRHGSRDGAVTEYSMIGLTQDGRVLYLDGCPCENHYAEVSL